MCVCGRENVYIVRIECDTANGKRMEGVRQVFVSPYITVNVVFMKLNLAENIDIAWADMI